VTLAAPAKLTLSLRVTGVRADGYHELQAEMVTVDLADILEIQPGVGVTIADEVVGGLGLGNLGLEGDRIVARALALVGRSESVRIRKRIPVGAGLGGGSADAAAVLRWAGLRDLEAAGRLGADVPFCVDGGRAMVTGVGDVLEPLDFEHRRFVLLLPPFGVETPRVYATWDALAARSSRSHSIAGDHNDLEEAALIVAPDLVGWRDALGNVTGKRPRLAGSGSTWFVEGSLEDLRLGDRPFLTLRGSHAPVIETRSVPPGWEPAEGAVRPRFSPGASDE